VARDLVHESVVHERSCKENEAEPADVLAHVLRETGSGRVDRERLGLHSVFGPRTVERTLVRGDVGVVAA
jgi:hypothetical protein